MARTPPIANESDPSFLRKLEATAARTPVRPSVVSNPVVYDLATQAPTSNAVTITQSVNNDTGDIVTVYNTNGTINVTAIDQTINDYTTIDSGVSQIIAGENIVVTSTQGNGIGVVTISTTAEPVFSASKIANGTSNVQVLLDGPVTVGIGGIANKLVISNTELSMSGTVVADNANLGNSVYANFFIGDGGFLSNVGGTYSNSNVANYLPTYTGTLSGSSIGVTGIASANKFIGNGAFLTNLSGPNVVGTVANAAHSIYAEMANIANTANTANFATRAGSSLTANTVTNNAQPNITSVGTLTELTVSGITNLGPAGNVIITGGSSGQVLSTNGSGNLSWITVSGGNGGGNGTAIINGSSSVVVELNGNVNTTINGTANIIQVTQNGTNMTGNLALDGDMIVGNAAGGSIEGAAYIESDNFVFKKFNETVIDGGTTAGSLVPDASMGTIYKYTLDDNISLNDIDNVVAGTSMTIILKQDEYGGHSIISSTWYWSGNNQTLTSDPDAIDIVSVFYDGTDYYATLSNNFVKYIAV